MSGGYDSPLNEYDRRAIRGWFKSMQTAAPGLVEELHLLAEGLTYEALLPVIQLYDYLLRYGDADALSRFDLASIENYPDALVNELARIIFGAKQPVFLYEPGVLGTHIDQLNVCSKAEEHPGHDLYNAAFDRALYALAFLAMQLPEGRRIVALRSTKAGKEIIPPFTNERVKRLPTRGHLRLVVSN